VNDHPKSSPKNAFARTASGTPTSKCEGSPDTAGLSFAPAAEYEAAQRESEAEGPDGEAADRERLPPRGQTLPAAERVLLLGGKRLAAALLAPGSPFNL